MRPPGSDKTTTTSSTTTVVGAVVPGGSGAATPPSTAAAPTVPTDFALVMPWPDGGRIPTRYTCDAKRQVGPVFNWFVPPDGTAEFAVVVDDPDADGFVHWVAAGIPPSMRTLDAAHPQDVVVQAVHDAGGIGWFGPCPPPGEGPHTYRFSLYALDHKLEIASRSPAADAIEAITDSALATATYTGVYSR
jgi:Raf kinase inhibitor-like YbhB/YbcL family protein